MHANDAKRFKDKLNKKKEDTSLKTYTEWFSTLDVLQKDHLNAIKKAATVLGEDIESTLADDKKAEHLPRMAGRHHDAAPERGKNLAVLKDRCRIAKEC